MRLTYVLLVLMLLSVSFTAWPVQALGQACFKINASENMTGLASSQWYDIAIVSLPNNNSMFDSATQGWWTAGGTSINVYKLAENSTHSVFAIPLQDNIQSGLTSPYCIYTGGAALNNLTTIAPYRLASTNTLTIKNSSGACTYNTTSGILSSTGYCGLYVSTAPTSSVSGMTVIIKGNFSGQSGAVYSSTGAAILPTSSTGEGSYAGYQTGWKATTGVSWGATNGSFYIMRMAATSNKGNASLYDTNYTNPSGGLFTASTTYKPQYLFLGWVNNSNLTISYSFAYDYVNKTPAVQDLAYDFQNPNITVQSPPFGSVQNAGDSVTAVVLYGSAFDNCTMYANGNDVANYTPIGSGDVEVQGISAAYIVGGSNNITVSCYLGGVEYHSYSFFTSTATAGLALFTSAFGVAPTCTDPAVLTELSKCTEYYKPPQYYNFSAVVCPSINTGLDYSCIYPGVSNVTKAGYTIFYSPAAWGYNKTRDVQHVGANFYYNGVTLDSRIELYDNVSFIYIPAQTNERDCGVYYLNTNSCSYWGGFTVNTGYVLVSDKSNNWYIRAGNGIVGFNQNYSNTTIDSAVLNINPFTTNNIYATGIYTRHQCNKVNNTFSIGLSNTVPHNYSIYVFGNVTYSITNYSGYSLQYDVPLANVSSVIVSDGVENTCYWSNSNNMALPFSFPAAWQDGFGNILLYVVMLFMVVLSTAVPFAILGAVLFNDLYHLLGVQEMVIIFLMASITGFISNMSSFNRGIKHVLLLTIIVASYLSVLQVYQTYLNIDLSAYVSLSNTLSAFPVSGSLEDITFGLFKIIVDIFYIVLTLPVLLVGLIQPLIYQISPTLANYAKPFMTILNVGIVLFLFLKVYEILSNRFRDV